MNNKPIAYGIDFGTSNSLISIAWPDRVEVLDVGGRRVPENLPSVIYLNADGNRDAGDRAIEQFLVSAGVNSRLLVGIKGDLSDPMFHTTRSWGLSWTPVDLVAVVMRALKNIADAYTGTTVERVVLGHPVRVRRERGGQLPATPRFGCRADHGGRDAGGFPRGRDT